MRKKNLLSSVPAKSDPERSIGALRAIVRSNSGPVSEEIEAVVAPPIAPPIPPAHITKTLKERSHQMSLYLEPEIYEELREIAHTERTKMHTLMLEAVATLLKTRQAKSGS